MDQVTHYHNAKSSVTRLQGKDNEDLDPVRFTVIQVFKRALEHTIWHAKTSLISGCPPTCSNLKRSSFAGVRERGFTVREIQEGFQIQLQRSLQDFYGEEGGAYSSLHAGK